MSEPSNGAWPFQEIPEEEGLDISAIFGNSGAAPQGDPFAPPAAAQSVPPSPAPVMPEITPAVTATSQPTTAPIAKAPVEAPAENAGYVNNIEKRIVPYFRGQRILLRELTALDVENFYSYCFNELHLKGTTVQRFHANIHKAMKYARKHDLIASNPMDNVERPKSQRYVGAFYSVSELETLFQAVKGDPCEFPVLMAAFYGLRRSEIMGLRWRAIDFENNLITIDHTVVQCMCDGTTITVEKDRTKNQSSCRSMPLVPQYRDLLLRMKVRQECCRKLCGNCYTESEYIFVNDMGEPYQPNYVTQHFKLVLRKNHLRSIRFHDLRHTCASLLLKNGVPMKDIQEWLGHSSYNTTANIYAHLDTSSKNTSASKMSNVVIIEPGISTSV